MHPYKKKPVVIQAIQLTRDNINDVQDLSPMIGHSIEGGLDIETLEGVMTAHFGDWIIRGVVGECYPCKPDIFEKTYEKA